MLISRKMWSGIFRRLVLPLSSAQGTTSVCRTHTGQTQVNYKNEFNRDCYDFLIIVILTSDMVRHFLSATSDRMNDTYGRQAPNRCVGNKDR
jgi:hypothetical protein